MCPPNRPPEQATRSSPEAVRAIVGQPRYVPRSGLSILVEIFSISGVCFALRKAGNDSAAAAAPVVAKKRRRVKACCIVNGLKKATLKL